MEFEVDDEPSFTLNEIKEGDVALVSRREDDRKFNTVLYIREHLVIKKLELDNFMNNDQKTRLYVTGPPGCGKTCFCLLWARQVNKRILIIQFRLKGRSLIWIREKNNGELCLLKTANARFNVLCDILEKADRENPFDLCIHDGALDWNEASQNIMSELNSYTAKGGLIAKTIHVTSLAFDIRIGENMFGKKSSAEHMSFDSWLEEDYVSAVKCEAFIQAVKKESSDDILEQDMFFFKKEEAARAALAGEATKEVSLEESVRKKYFYAGGCARFMFQLDLEDLEIVLNKKLQKVPDNDWLSFAHGFVSSGTNVTVNTLMQRFGDIAVPVSKFVLLAASEKCGQDLINSIEAAARNVQNPALRGWAFELGQLERIRSSFLSSNHFPLYITNGKEFAFRPTSQVTIDEQILSNDVHDGAVIWCKKPNQGCYDVAFYWSKTLMVLQFTVQIAPHSLKLQYVRKLREAILNKGCIVNKVMLIGVRKDNWEQLGFQPPSGTGKSGRSNSGEAEFEIDICLSPELTTTATHTENSFQMAKKIYSVCIYRNSSGTSVKHTRIS